MKSSDTSPAIRRVEIGHEHERALEHRHEVQVVGEVSSNVVRELVDALLDAFGGESGSGPDMNREERITMIPEDVAALIDHTRLAPDATAGDITELCREAAELRVAAVCVNPVWVRLAVRALSGSGVQVCSVVGFPLGATLADVKAYKRAAPFWTVPAKSTW